ncbi:MAG: hypothetical protein M3R46_05095 [Actinomycetota bacterium]|nr:hypothetical protein [Actinomycetota bacterium]
MRTGCAHRIKDERVLRLIKAFLKAGVLRQHGGLDRSVTGTPQGGILSPLLANIALSALDEHFARGVDSDGHRQPALLRAQTRQGGLPTRALRR